MDAGHVGKCLMGLWGRILVLKTRDYPHLGLKEWLSLICPCSNICRLIQWFRNCKTRHPSLATNKHTSNSWCSLCAWKVGLWFVGQTCRRSFISLACNCIKHIKLGHPYIQRNAEVGLMSVRLSVFPLLITF